MKKFMSPEMRRFMPEFTSFTVMYGGKDITGDCMLEVDDRGRAVMSLDKPASPKVESQWQPMQAVKSDKALS